ncbi:MAG: hypothetical protein HY394_00900 [Candidatus Diapherotrites archaeon]|nr:hypothetical protein [Candidatus Diapherotrites archaeon]
MAVEKKAKTVEAKKAAQKKAESSGNAEKKQAAKSTGPATKTKRTGPKRSKETKKLQEKIRQKRRLLFKGRFGNRSIRRVANKKWQKWRKPRGIDNIRDIENGPIPKTGYGTDRRIRHLHPSGYAEILVANEKDIERLSAGQEIALRISGTVGKKKREQITKKAKEKNLLLLN